MKKIYTIVTGLLLCTIAWAQAPIFTNIIYNTAAPARLEKFELTVSLTATYTNPYDYDDIALQSIFTAPSGKKDTVDGFYMQPYTMNLTTGNLSASGSGLFKVRYTPIETGTYTYILSCTNTVGTTTQPVAAFNATAAASKGFIRKNTTNYLSFDNGEQYIPIGENLAWQQSNRYTDYKVWTQKLADNKANLIRLWLCHWGFGIEWKNAYDNFEGLRKYKQTNAYYLDWLLDECKAKGLYMMLCINHHGQVSTTTDANWSDNPYNAANGGPCTNTWDFFTNASAKATHKNRLRYILARWGYSTSIQSWELFNEVDWTNNFTGNRSSIKDWMGEMAAYLKLKDVAKHLVTTSFANDAYDADTWNLANIDFTQTHYYSSAANIEMVVNAGVQSYLTRFGKPTINGEFGLTPPSGVTLSNADSTGTTVHNSIWATTFNGAMGSAMPWYWNDYIDPRNLYDHFNGLASVVANIPLKDANFKPAATATIISSVAADVSVSPAAGYGLAPAGNFTINADGTITPGATQLSQYLFGSVYNTQNRQPPTFNVNYPVAGQFIVTTAGSAGTAPTITIYVDGTQVLNQNAVVNTGYIVNLAAGSHVIKVDNLGIDWIQISSYRFTNIGSPLNRYLLKSADSLRVAGWIHNKNYNWQYLRSNSAVPPAITDAAIQLTAVKNGAYNIVLYNCNTGLQTGTINATAANNTLSFTLPAIAWDMAFTATASSVLPIVLNSFTGSTIGTINHLNIDIAASQNVHSVVLERSNDGINFTTIAIASATWNTIAGIHTYPDEKPANGVNYYRLKIVDRDGRITWSNVVRLENSKALFSVYPNPFASYVVVQTPAGKYTAQLTDAAGRLMITQTLVSTAAQSTRLPLPSLLKGTYFLALLDAQGKVVYQQSLIK